jgi:hypothetical protein
VQVKNKPLDGGIFLLRRKTVIKKWRSKNLFLILHFKPLKFFDKLFILFFCKKFFEISDKKEKIENFFIYILKVTKW